VHAVAEAGRSVTADPLTLSALWRQKQLEYTWLRSLMGRYEDFWSVTEAALRFALRRLDLSAGEADIARLMEAYLSLDPFPEARAALEALAGPAAGAAPLGILSNGSPRMLAAAVRSSGLGPLLAHVLSVDAVRTYKPAPAVYALGTRALGLAASEVLFVSSNGWDVAGAKACGYRVCWCNRAGAPVEGLGLRPDLEVSRLDELPAHLAA
jgi:2-haloacid dehalogenase